MWLKPSKMKISITKYAQYANKILLLLMLEDLQLQGNNIVR